MSDPDYTNTETDQYNSAFFGRQTEVVWLLDRLAQQQRVLVYGSHGIGKSALLKHLSRHLPQEYLGVYLNTKKIDTSQGISPLLQIASEIGRAIREQTRLQLAPPNATAFEEDPLLAWQSYLDIVSACMDYRGLLLLIDNTQLASSVWLQAVLDARVKNVLAFESSDQIAALFSDNASSLPVLKLGPLDNDAAELMVKRLLSFKSQVDPRAVRRILEITSNHPYYIRHFCQVLTDCCSLRTQIMPPDVEETLDILLRDPSAEFDAFWRVSSPIERALLAVFSALKGRGGIATHYDIERSCAQYGKSIRLQAIIEGLNSLAQRDILERLGTNNFRFRLELFRLWIRVHHQPEESLKQRLWTPKSPAGETRVQRWLLWGIAGVVLLLVLIAGLPSIRQGWAETTPSPPPKTVLPSATPVLTRRAVTATVETPVPTPQPTMALAGYDLLFMGRLNAESPWQIYALNTHTSERLRLTDTVFNERTPKWSPDRRQILFASDRDGNHEIYTMNVDGRNLVNLTQHKAHDWQPAWSPDGKRIAFSSYRDDNWEVYVIDADGTDLVRLTDHEASDFSPTWSPDGARILFASRRTGNADLFVIDLDTRKLTQLTHNKMDEYEPDWSADGQWIAYVTQIADQSDIFVMRADGSGAMNLTDSPYANDFQPAWTNYAEGLIFVSYTTDDGDYDLFRMRRDGRELVRLTDNTEDDVSPNWRYVGQ